MTAATSSPSASNGQVKLICLLLAAFVGLVFGQTVHFDFVNYDDSAYVYENPAVVAGLSPVSFVWVFTHVNHGTWFPLTDLTHQLDWQLFGDQAGGHHLTNVTLHAAAVIFLFLALRRLTGACWRSALVAAVFAIHPLRAESVAWVVERKDVLSGLFFALTLFAWAGHLEKRAADLETPAALPRLGGTPEYYYALLFFSLGLLAKSMLVTLPGVLLLLDYWPRQRFPAPGPFFSRRQLSLLSRLVWEKIPFFSLSATIAVITWRTQHNAIVEADHCTPLWRLANALEAYTAYLGHTFFPMGLTVAYAPADTAPTPWGTTAALVLLLVISLAAVASWKKYPYLLMGWLWFVGLLLPVIDIMQANKNAHADRYTYLPQIGLLILFTWGLADFFQARRWPRSLIAALAGLLLLALGLAAHRQTSYWRDSETLWSRSLNCNPENALAWNTLGSALFKHGHEAEARRDFQRALHLQPDYPEALVNLGVSSANLNHRSEAIALFERALQLNPANADAYYNLGDALANEGKLTEAIAQFDLALQCRPHFPEAEYDLGLALARTGQWDAAAAHYQRALRVRLNAADVRYITGVALAAQKNWDAAIPLYEAALKLKPDYAEAHYRLGQALAATEKTAAAMEHFHQALARAQKQNNSALAADIKVEIKKLEAAPPPR
jgi:protein O-mannosyl-transferase